MNFVEHHHNTAVGRFEMVNLTINFGVLEGPGPGLLNVDNGENVDNPGKTHTSRRTISTKKTGLRDGD
jgi:hypothetical protein